jgi:hypothetical protein
LIKLVETLELRSGSFENTRVIFELQETGGVRGFPLFAALAKLIEQAAHTAV